MPEQADKPRVTDHKSFKFFPREWEGIHDAFPEMPPALDLNSPILPSITGTTIGALGGLLWNTVRALQRKPLQHAVLNGIGLVTVPFTAFNLLSSELTRRSALPDVKAILKADGIELPKRRFMKQVNSTTADTYALFMGGLAMSGLLIYRRAANIPKIGKLTWLGTFTAGQCLGVYSHGEALKSDPSALLLGKNYHDKLEKGSRIYTARTNKPPHQGLYGALERLRESEAKSQVAARSLWPSLASHHGASHVGTPNLTEDEDSAIPEWNPEEASAGTEPHEIGMNQDGKKVVVPQRDFAWNPASKETGLEALQDHLEDLQKSRKAAVESAQYLWEMIARHEAEHYPPYGRDTESNDINLQKKALELLSSIHRQHYSQIADLDWCIANTQKLMLQTRSEGKWLPAHSDGTGAAEARDKLLTNIRTHKKNLEVQNSTMDESLEMMPVPDDVKEEIRRAVADNLAATTKLLDELEADAGKR